ncbi:hypothetical protein BOTBODRAFT_122582, partial [Botryobasidium botryosum FD-172 SS1]
DDIERCRERLFKELSQFHKYQDREFPRLRDHLTQISIDEVENITLHLPSDFSATDRSRLGLHDLGKYEYDLRELRCLREGEAYDAIRHLREALKENFISVQFKKKNVRGQKDSMRSHTVLKKMKEDVHQCAQKYRQARAALVSLGLDTVSSKLQPLHDRECYLRDVTQKRRLGAEEVVEPWFWTLEDITKDGEPLSEWSLNVDSVRWFRARADRDRYQEELEILPEELNRVNRHHSRMSSIWAQLAGKSTHAGAVAYAFKKAAMYKRLAMEAQSYISNIEAVRHSLYSQVWCSAHETLSPKSNQL